MFGGMGNMGNMAGMMKKVQKMQNDMKKMQDELKRKTVDVTSGGGAVKITMNGACYYNTMLTILIGHFAIVIALTIYFLRLRYK